MAHSIPTTRIPRPGHLSPGHLSGICIFSKKMLQMPYGGARIFIQINTVGPQEEGKMPDPWDNIKILFND